MRLDLLAAINIAALIVWVLVIARATRLERLARENYHAALQARLVMLWCHQKMMQGWHPWSEYPPPPGVLIDVLQPGARDIPHILRVPEDEVPALQDAWWRPLTAREGVARIGGQR